MATLILAALVHEFNMLRVIPECEKYGINAAIIAKIIEDNNLNFDGKWYINDGARSIRHETNFQEYLIKYFGFRKAYCNLKIKYRRPYGWLVNLIYPFRNYISGKSKIGSLVSGILKMEQIVREDRVE